MRNALPFLACAAALLSAAGAGCASGPQLPSQLLSGETDAPSLFLGSAPSAPVVGFLGKDVLVDVAGPSVSGRVPVRVRGALLVRGFMPAKLLSMRTQRHGRLRGTPVYLGPNDPVTVVGKGENKDRLKVRATPRVADMALPAFEGTYPAIGLAARAATNAEAPPPGEAYLVPANTPFKLLEQPQGKVIAELPARPEPLLVRVLGKQSGWSAVRVGSGPYLVGYTDQALQPAGADTPPKAAPSEDSASKAAGSELPLRLVEQSGELRRVAAGASIRFGESVIARLQQPGFARVLATYPNGDADALVAVDNQVAVRGLLRGTDLSAPDAAPTTVQ